MSSTLFRIARIAVGSLFTVLVSIQFLPIYPHDNPPLAADHTMESEIDVHPKVKAIIDRACRDCHSNETRWPWYSYVAPMKWLIVQDVQKARAIMNFSEWSEASGVKLEKAVGMLAASCSDLTIRRMPKPEYLQMHKAAVISEEDVKTFCAWALEEEKVLMVRKRQRAVKKLGY